MGLLVMQKPKAQQFQLLFRRYFFLSIRSYQDLSRCFYLLILLFLVSNDRWICLVLLAKNVIQSVIFGMSMLTAKYQLDLAWISFCKCSDISTSYLSQFF